MIGLFVTRFQTQRWGFSFLFSSSPCLPFPRMAASTLNGSLAPLEPVPPLDLVGEPFAVVESDPLLFTKLLRGLGVTDLEFSEVFSVDAEELNRLSCVEHSKACGSSMTYPSPHGLVFCYNDAELEAPPEQEDPSPSPGAVPAGFWFANQVAADACATIAILNTLFNLRDDVGFQLGAELDAFRRDTQGLAGDVRAPGNVEVMLSVHSR